MLRKRRQRYETHSPACRTLQFEFLAPISDGLKGGHVCTHARVPLGKHTWTMRLEKPCNRNMRVLPRWEGTWSQHRETTPRRVRNYAAESPAFSDTRRAALKRKNKLRHRNFETTPRNSNLVQRFPLFHARTLAAEIPYVELTYNNIPIGDVPGRKLRRDPPPKHA